MRHQEVRQLWLVGLALIGGCSSEEKVISPVDPGPKVDCLGVPLFCRRLGSWDDRPVAP